MWTLASFFNASRIFLMRSLLTYEVMSLKCKTNLFVFGFFFLLLLLLYSLLFDWYSEPHLIINSSPAVQPPSGSDYTGFHTHLHRCISPNETCFHLQIMFYWFFFLSCFPRHYMWSATFLQRFICLFCWSTVSLLLIWIADAATGFVIYSFFLVSLQICCWFYSLANDRYGLQIRNVF